MSGVFVNIPVLNEVENISELVERLRASLQGCEYTVLFVDDGSTDGTLDLLAKLKAEDSHIQLLNRKKSGPGCQRGGALFTGMLWGLANTAHTVFVEMDGDLSHRPEELPTGVKLTERPDVDFVIGSKYLPSSRQVDREVVRQSISSLYNFLTRMMINRMVTDYSNGLRFYTRAVALSLSNHVIRYTTPIYLSEILAIVLAENRRIAEYPSTYVGRIEGESKVRMSDFVEGVLALFDISYRYHSGKFARDSLVAPTGGAAT